MAHAVAVAMAKDAGVWTASVTSLQHWTPTSSQRYPSAAKGLNEDLGGINTIAVESDGNLVVGFSAAGNGAGLQRLAGGQWKEIDVPGLKGSTLVVSSLLIDRAGALWVGTYGDGLYRIVDGQAQHLRSSEGLSSDTIDALFEDREGNLWVCTSAGLDRFRDLRVVSYSSRQGLAEDQAQSLSPSLDGSMWIGNTDTLDRLTEGHVTSIKPQALALGRQVLAVSEDRVGRLWAGIDDGLVIREKNGFKRVPSPDGKPLGAVVDIAQGTGGTTWALTISQPRRLLHIVRDRVEDTLDVKGNRLLAGRGGDLWIAVAGGGLARYRAGRLDIVFKPDPPTRTANGMTLGPDDSVYLAGADGIVAWRDGVQKRMTVADGLPCTRVIAPVFDLHGALWLYSVCGLLRISGEELATWWSRPGSQVHPLVIDSTDGVQTGFANFGTSAARSTDGRLWFVNGNQLQTVDPDRLRSNPVIPPVHVEALMADHVRQDTGNAIHLAAGVRDVEVDYTATSFVIPQKVLFRYRLEGYNEGWQEAGRRRSAFYTNLAPGHYRFRVIACNDDGLWNQAGATLDFDIPPTFTQTRWFIALCVGLAALAIWAIVWLRLRQTTVRIRAGLEERLRERERIGRELHDTLLQSTQGLVLTIHGTLKRLAADDPTRSALESAVTIADATISEGRDRIQALRAIDSSGQDLEREFARLGGELAQHHAALFEVNVHGAPRLLNASVADELLRIGSEAITNAFRHAGAARIGVALDFQSRGVRIEFSDDGKGIEEQTLATGGVTRHWGLPGMLERAARVGARIDIASAPNQGTTVNVFAPASIAYLDAPTTLQHLRDKWREAWKTVVGQ